MFKIFYALLFSWIRNHGTAEIQGKTIFIRDYFYIIRAFYFLFFCQMNFERCQRNFLLVISLKNRNQLFQRFGF